MTQKKVYTTAHDLIRALSGAREEVVPSYLAEANEYLATALSNYLGMMRQRLTYGAYEFMIPRYPFDGIIAGWYWRHPSQDPLERSSWTGPFDNRKAAVADRVNTNPQSRLDIIERQIFEDA